MSFQPGSGFSDPHQDHSKREWMPAYALTVETVTTLLVAVRLVSRLNRTAGRAGIDDILICGGWLTGLAMTVLIVMCMYRDVARTCGQDTNLTDSYDEIWHR
jgi:hypothetical protein